MSAVTSIGGLLPKDLLDRVVTSDSTLPGTGPEQYGLAPGERLNDAITRSWNRLVGLWERFVADESALPNSERAATGMTRQRFVIPLLQELGFADLAASPGLRVEGKDYAISHEWGGSVPIHLVGVRVAIDKRTPGVSGAAQTSPHGLVQEFLNRSDAHLWAIVCNGRFLRMLRDNASLTRQAYVEFDLSAMFDGEQYSDFVVLWLTCHRTRFVGDRPELCLLERWSHEAEAVGTRALDRLRDGVEEAIRSLGEGFLAQPNPDLKGRLRSGELTKHDFLRQLLRVIYRILFLLVAESRNLLLVPDASEESCENYRRFYSVERLRRLAVERRGSAHTDLWAGFMVVVRSLSAEGGAPRLGLAPLGSFLWSEQSTRDIDTALIDNRYFLDAIRNLTLVRDSDSRINRAVDYRNLGAEELGSIYEALLELHATIDVDAGAFSLGVSAGHERRTTGSYYTPASLIVELLDSALDPVINEAAGCQDPEKALLSLRVLDPACGSGHFLIAAANRIAYRVAAVRSGDNEPSPIEVRHALRDVVGVCVYGIDVNPMAVELCKVSLWMEALDPGLPLSFLEHRIACGNALLGTTPRLLSEGIPNAAYNALEGDDRDVAASLRKANKEERAGQRTLGLFSLDIHEMVEPLATGIDDIDSLPDDNVINLIAKNKRFEDLIASDTLYRAKASADAWCTAFMIDKRKGVPPITTDAVQRIANKEGTPPRELMEIVEETAEKYAFLHPHIAFPEVFDVPVDLADAETQDTGWSGGFDVVLGNPPWERIKNQPKEWFASRAPEIARAPNKENRDRMIRELSEAPEGSPERELAAEWLAAQREAAKISHLLRSSGRYPYGGVGDVNVYAVFADMIRNSINGQGRAGFICPVGLAVGATYAPFFRHLLEKGMIVSFFSFENEERLFPAVHNETKFALVTLSGSLKPSDEVAFTGYVRQSSQIRDSGRLYYLTAEEIEAINPNTLTAPLFRNTRDAQITARLHASGVPLFRQEPEDNPWRINLISSLYHSSSDAPDLLLAADLADELPWTGVPGDLDERRYVPVYEGKMIWHFDHRYGTYERQTENQENKGVLPHVPVRQKQNSDELIQFRVWVDRKGFEDRLQDRWTRDWLLGFRDVGPSERTLVAAIIPRLATGDKLPLILPNVPTGDCAVLTACLCSLPADYALRQKTASSVKLYVIQQVPVIHPDSLDKETMVPNVWLRNFIVPRVVEMSFTSVHLQGFGEECELAGRPFRWDDRRRENIQAELDALFFHLYGLNRGDTEWVIDSFNVLRKYEERPPEKNGFGEFRTKRLVLEFYDRMAEAITAGRPYESPINPPPADDAQRHPAPVS